MSWRLISETAKQKWGLSIEKNFKVNDGTGRCSVEDATAAVDVWPFMARGWPTGHKITCEQSIRLIFTCSKVSLWLQSSSQPVHWASALLLSAVSDPFICLRTAGYLQCA